MGSSNYSSLDGTPATVLVAGKPDLDGSKILIRSSEHTNPTFKCCLLAFAMVATPTDVIVIQGSATRTVRIKQIKIGGVATSQGNMPVQLIRRSTANSGGTAVLTPIVPGKLDPTDAAMTAVVSSVGTGNFGSLGTSAGIEGVGRLSLPASGTGVVAVPTVWDYATHQDKALILRGTLDFICINFNGAAVPAGTLVDFEIELEEDAS